MTDDLHSVVADFEAVIIEGFCRLNFRFPSGQCDHVVTDQDGRTVLGWHRNVNFWMVGDTEREWEAINDVEEFFHR